MSPRRLATIDQQIGSGPGRILLTLVSLRVFLPPAFDAVSYGCGLVRVPFGWFALATVLGETPKVGGFTYIGAAAGDASNWLTAWILLLLAPAIGLVALRVLRSRRRQASSPTDVA